MQPDATRPDPEDPLTDSVVPPQDGFRKIYFGEIGDPLVPPHPEPPEAPEDELTQAALSDGARSYPEHTQPAPTAWRAVAMLLVGAFALAYLFLRR